MRTQHLIDIANLMSKECRLGRPRQTSLNRAVSTAYYAMFHALCRNCADTLVGTAGSNRSIGAWQQTYRSVEHNFAKNQCTRDEIKRFPSGIQDFAKIFVVTQRLRHLADYDPHYRISRSNTQILIRAEQKAINKLEGTDRKDRLALAVWTVLKKRV